MGNIFIVIIGIILCIIGSRVRNPDFYLRIDIFKLALITTGILLILCGNGNFK